MTGITTIPLRLPAVNRWLLAALLCYGAVTVVSLREYIEFTSVNFLLGALTLFMLSGVERGRPSNRFAYVAIVLGLLTMALPVKTILYFAVGAALLFTIESYYGRSGLLPFLVIGLMSPIFKYFINIFSFPIRLQLTEWAGKILTMTSEGVQVQGNIIYDNGKEFVVDPECMGLNMMVTSLVMAVMFIALFQKRYARQFALWQTGVLLCAVVIFNIISNLVRIVCLVHFSIMPETFMHDVTGLICLLVYVIVPSAWLTAWLMRKFGRLSNQAGHYPVPLYISNLHLLRQALVAAVILLAAINIVKRQHAWADVSAPAPALKGYTVNRVSADILKLENGSSLVYVKRIPGFYNTDHHPMICWKGSGYGFFEVRQENVDGSMVYSAILKNDRDQLYTSWWYDNGRQRTLHQMDWRLDVLKGAPDYSVVNVTAASREELYKQVKAVKSNGALAKILHN
jgi:exosortase N